MAFLLWRLPAGGAPGWSHPRRLSAKSERCAPPWAERSDAAALDHALSGPLVCSLTFAWGCGCPMAPWADPFAAAPGSTGSAASAARSSQDSGKGGGQPKGGKRGGKGSRGQDPTLQQLGHLAPQAKALQASAAALGWATSISPNGPGKGQQLPSPEQQTLQQLSMATSEQQQRRCFLQALQESYLRLWSRREGVQQ